MQQQECVSIRRRRRRRSGTEKVDMMSMLCSAVLTHSHYEPESQLRQLQESDCTSSQSALLLLLLLILLPAVPGTWTLTAVKSIVRAKAIDGLTGADYRSALDVHATFVSFAYTLILPFAAALSASC